MHSLQPRNTRTHATPTTRELPRAPQLVVVQTQRTVRDDSYPSLADSRLLSCRFPAPTCSRSDSARESSTSGMSSSPHDCNGGAAEQSNRRCRVRAGHAGQRRRGMRGALSTHSCGRPEVKVLEGAEWASLLRVDVHSLHTCIASLDAPLPHMGDHAFPPIPLLACVACLCSPTCLPTPHIPLPDPHLHGP